MSLAEEHVRDFTRACVRSGLQSDDELVDEVAQAITAELPDRAFEAVVLAKSWVGQEREQLRRDQTGWAEYTDYERLQAAFTEMERADVVVLQGCDDHWTAKEVLDERAATGRVPRGVAWFTPPDVWHAVDEGMLEVNLWHGTTANAAPGDQLLDEMLAILDRNGLDARFDEGRIEIAAHWHRRIA